MYNGETYDRKMTENDFESINQYVTQRTIFELIRDTVSDTAF